MPPKTKGKSKKNKGATDPAPTKKQVKKAAKWAHVSVPIQQDLGTTDDDTDFIGDETVPAPRDDMAQRMDLMMAMVLDLTQKVQASDSQQTKRADSPIGSPSTSHDDRRRARC